VLAVNSRGEVKARRSATTSTCATSRAAARCCSARPRTTTPAARSAPFIRLFDAQFGIDDVRRCDLALRVTGPDGFVLEAPARSRMISRDPLDLVGQAIGRTTSTPTASCSSSAPCSRRPGPLRPGQGFTHAVGDIVAISTPRLGTLVNRVNTSDRIAPWTYGAAR
jgi:fumarylacetoacetate (FAA) hydrolase family protein